MNLDIIVATCNRADRLRLLLESIARARRPASLHVRVLVADNNSTDATRGVVESCPPIHGSAPLYLFERRPGKSYALNHALARIEGDIVGFVDDDERLDEGWLEAVRSVFEDPAVAFASGPCRPEWGAPPPAWLPRDRPGVIGWLDAGSDVLEYGAGYDGIMMGGNAVIRREWIRRVGLFDTSLGKFGTRPTVGEDADYYERLRAAGARGLYVPHLMIHHYVPPDRLARGYFRRWSFNRGVSLARIDRQRPQPVKYVLGVPRYMVGNAVRGAAFVVRALVTGGRDPEQTFTRELALWDLGGFVYGKLRH